MMNLLYNIFILNWQRKCTSVVIAVVIWASVSRSLTTTKTLENVPVHIINITPDRTVEGMNKKGILSKRISLTLFGPNKFLDDLSPNDLEVVIDASGKEDDWVAPITKKNLQSQNPAIDISKGIASVQSQNFIVHITKLVREKIPIFVTDPIGEPPTGYQFSDVYPYRLSLQAEGPEEIIKHLKSKGLKLTFNLNDISKKELDALSSNQQSSVGVEVNYFVPKQWKEISIPLLSDKPFKIEDPQAKKLCIEFLRSDLIPIEKPVPVQLYFPPETLHSLDSDRYTIQTNELIDEIKSVPFLKGPLFAKGVSSLFAQIVQDMLEIQVIVYPFGDGVELDWCLQCVNPRMLEDRYVSTVMSYDQEMGRSDQPLKEEYLRNRFRNYMQRLLLFKQDNTKLRLDVELHDNKIFIEENCTLK